MPRGKPFEAGNTVRKGSANPNAGRTPDWLKEKCREIIDRAKIVEFLADVANGANVEQAVGGEGEVISVPAAVRDRLKATEILLERAYGKAGQAIDLTVTDESELASASTQDLRDVFAAFSGGTVGPNQSGTGKAA